MEINKYLEDSGVLLECVTKTTESKLKNKKVDFLGMHSGFFLKKCAEGEKVSLELVKEELKVIKISKSKSSFN